MLMMLLGIVSKELLGIREEHKRSQKTNRQN